RRFSTSSTRSPGTETPPSRHYRGGGVRYGDGGARQYNRRDEADGHGCCCRRSRRAGAGDGQPARVRVAGRARVPARFQRLQGRRQFSYPGEGWGLTHDGVNLIMSDGTDYLRILDPETFQMRRRVRVMAAGAPLRNLNELEYVKGEVLANIWTTDYIARIDPS